MKLYKPEAHEPERLDLTVLAVRWDDISGPSIISLFPVASLDDPESVALQIYLASVTVFGQHGHSQRTEFSVPLLSLGQDITARVAFDSWIDTSLRGKERPFFLAFLSDKSTEKLMNSHLETFIFKYLDVLKEEGSNFSTQTIWEKIIESLSTTEDREKFDAISFDVDSDYAIPRALQDLETAKNAWENLKDRNQLWTALKVANRLENVDDKGAGHAFSLVGQIFLAGNNFREGGEAFEKAANAYARVQLFEESGEASCFAGNCAYHVQEFERAIELLQTGAMWIKDPLLIASLNNDMGIVLHEQSRFDEANSCFEKAVKLTKEKDHRIAAKYSSTYASRLMFQAEKEREENPAYALGLVRRSAEQRVKAGHFLQKYEEGQKEAATSLILAVNAYFSLGNNKRAVKLLEEATNLFIEARDYISASRSLYDGARTIKDHDRAYELLSRAEGLLEEQEANIQKDRILGLVLFEKGKIEEIRNQLQSAIDSFDIALKSLKESNAPISDFIHIQIQSANILFRLEDFENAAQMFLAGYKGLSTLPPTEILLEQRRKALLNALISLKRASRVYHDAGIIALKRKEEKRAIDMFTQSISHMIEWIENNTKNNKQEVQKVVKNRISLLTLKMEQIIQAESKFKLKSIIEGLDMALQALESSENNV